MLDRSATIWHGQPASLPRPARVAQVIPENERTCTLVLDMDLPGAQPGQFFGFVGVDVARERAHGEAAARVGEYGPDQAAALRSRRAGDRDDFLFRHVGLPCRSRELLRCPPQLGGGVRRHCSEPQPRAAGRHRRRPDRLGEDAAGERALADPDGDVGIADDQRHDLRAVAAHREPAFGEGVAQPTTNPMMSPHGNYVVVERVGQVQLLYTGAK